MADATVIDGWLDQWEGMNDAGQVISPSEFAARYCGDATPDLIQAFIVRANALLSVDERLLGKGPTAGEELPDTVIQGGTAAALAPGGEIVPGYCLVKPLGKGGFGTVWEATAPGGFSVALKFLDLRGAAGIIERKALKLVKKLRHAHVLSVSAAYEVGPWLVIACELADQSLADRLAECRRQGPEGVPVAELLRYMREAAEGLDYLNGMGIQHRDVKPLNLLLVGGSLKVADLGLLKQLAAAEASHTGWKTSAYAPPEFFDDKTSSQSDQYSLAASYCELRGGRLPFTGSQAQLMWGHLQQEPDLTMLPEAERPIVLRALSKKAEKRWPSCTAFVEQLEVALRESTTATPVSPQERNRRRWLASGEPRLWVHERKARWGDKELQSLLARLERSDYWPLDADAVVEVLTQLKQTWRKPGARLDGPRGLRFAWVPPGSFLMGSPEGEEGRGDDEAQHRVRITRGFWLGAFPVTQKQYRKLVGNNPSRFKGDDHPAETVTWESATEFCRQLSKRENRVFRLPTEAEWEYACRAGGKNAYYFGSKSHRVGQLGSLADKVLGGLAGGKDYLAAYAWYESNAGGRTRAVGQKKPNAWGLFDMHGNVWEWCSDWYDKGYYAKSPEVDPSGPPSGAWKVLRGGSWANEARRCRSAQRSWLPPHHPERYGFRVLLEADDAWGRNE